MRKGHIDTLYCPLIGYRLTSSYTSSIFFSFSFSSRTTPSGLNNKAHTKCGRWKKKIFLKKRNVKKKINKMDTDNVDIEGGKISGMGLYTQDENKWVKKKKKMK